MPGETSVPKHAPVLWAQRKDLLYVTIDVEDCKDPKFEITAEKLHFRGHGGPEGADFECDIVFYAEIDSDNVRRMSESRNIQFVIPKKEMGPFWPRLLKTTSKAHWLKVDFNKWKDEDESDDEGGFGGGGADFGDLMGKMDGFDGSGPPDLGSFEDSDDEDMPDLEDGPDDEDTEAINGKESTDPDTHEGAGDHTAKPSIHASPSKTSSSDATAAVDTENPSADVKAEG